MERNHKDSRIAEKVADSLYSAADDLMNSLKELPPDNQENHLQKAVEQVVKPTVEISKIVTEAADHLKKISKEL
ncbi:hypothetical protein ACYSNR_02355 [Enterococcus sp. LJL128]|uniref:hypothetical protein n=1 Tax=Enterococcus sp. LJL51 TaxID=3416656 RepID=UPI003CED0D56